MLNPFIIAGLILTGVGLLQEASDADGNPIKLIPGPEGKPGKDGKTVVIPAEQKPKKEKAKVEKPSDG